MFAEYFINKRSFVRVFYCITGSVHPEFVFGFDF